MQTKDLKPRGHKAPIQIVPIAGLGVVAGAMEDGMVKYLRNNWQEATSDWQETYVGAGLRHLYALASGESRAPDTRIRHEGHAGACALIGLYHSLRRDDDSFGQGYTEVLCQLQVDDKRGDPEGLTPCLPMEILNGSRSRSVTRVRPSKFSLIPAQPLEAIAGAYEHRFFLVSRSQYEVMDFGIYHFNSALCSSGLVLTYHLALAGAACILLGDNEVEFEESLNVQAYELLGSGAMADGALGDREWEDPATPKWEAMERMRAVMKARGETVYE